MNLWNELRILFAELLIHQALRVMPRHAAEAVPLAKALDGYVTEASQIRRWEKFPA